MKDLRDRLKWQPVGTHKRNTMPFELVEKFPSMLYIHEQTVISSTYVFLILEVGAQECVVGTTEEDTLLGKIMYKKIPKLMKINARELLRLFSATEKEEDEQDKKLRQSLILKRPSEISEELEDKEMFFYDLCQYLNKNMHNSIYRNSANTPKSKE